MELKFIRTVPTTNYLADQTVTIGAGGGSDTVENVPTLDQALELEIEGKRYIILAALSKD